MNDKHITNTGHGRISTTKAYGGSPPAYVSNEAPPVRVEANMGHSRISIEAVLTKYTGRKEVPAD